MKKEFGKWLMDIAKYVITAVIISSGFNDFNNWTDSGKILTISAVIITTVLGLYLTKESKTNKKKGKK